MRLLSPLALLAVLAARAAAAPSAEVVKVGGRYVYRAAAALRAAAAAGAADPAGGGRLAESALRELEAFHRRDCSAFLATCEDDREEILADAPETARLVNFVCRRAERSRKADCLRAALEALDDSRASRARAPFAFVDARDFCDHPERAVPRVSLAWDQCVDYTFDLWQAQSRR